MLTRSGTTLSCVVTSFLISVAALLGGSRSAVAADYPLPTHEIGTVNGTEFRVGDTVVFRGDSYLAVGGSAALKRRASVGSPASNRVSVTDNGRLLGATAVDAAGRFEFSFVIPSTAALGKHVLVGRGIGWNGASRDTTAVYYVVGVQTVVQPVSGGASDPANGGHTLPFTGSDVVSLLVAAVVLVCVGALLVRANLAARSRRRVARRARRSPAV